MSDADDNADFSDAFCDFVQHSIPAVDAAELLLLLSSDPRSAWWPRDLIAKLEPVANLSEAEVGKHLDLFQQRGLIVRLEDGRAEFQPVSPEIDAHVRTLARLYNERPVTLIRVIYALRDTKIKTFADAFKFRR